jgi:hypothetical protein
MLIVMLNVVMLSVILVSVVMPSVVVLSVVMLSVIMLSVIMLSVIMLSVIMLSVIVLSVIMLNVVAPVLPLLNRQILSGVFPLVTVQMKQVGLNHRDTSKHFTTISMGGMLKYIGWSQEEKMGLNIGDNREKLFFEKKSFEKRIEKKTFRKSNGMLDKRK